MEYRCRLVSDIPCNESGSDCEGLNRHLSDRTDLLYLPEIAELRAPCALAAVDANHYGGRTMVRVGFCANTPVDIVVFRWVVSRLVAFIPVAEASSAISFAATVVVRNDVAHTVRGILAGAYPGHG